MTEIIEYTLVVMVSALFVTGSVAVYDSFSGLESKLQLEGTLATVSDLALQAAASGTSSATLSLPGVTISCEQSNLTIYSGSVEVAHSVPVPCDFTRTVGAGDHSLTFTVAGGALSLEVT